jgi:hypothetical protein
MLGYLRSVVRWLRFTPTPTEFACEAPPQYVVDLQVTLLPVSPPWKRHCRVLLWEERGTIAIDGWADAAIESRNLPAETVGAMRDLAARAIEECPQPYSPADIRDGDKSVLHIYQREPYREVRQSLCLARWRSLAPPTPVPSRVLLARALFGEFPQ